MDPNALTIEREVLAWTGITSEPGGFGAVAFRHGKREVGHVHRDRLADLPVTRETHEDPLKEATPGRTGRASRVTSAIRFKTPKTSARLSRSSARTRPGESGRGGRRRGIGKRGVT